MTNAEPVFQKDAELVRTNAAFDCGGRCPLRLSVKDGKVVRVEGDDTAGVEDQLRACLRCRAYRKYVHHPERLRHPMKRTGPKGKGEFTRISWEEAYDTVISSHYGNVSSEGAVWACLTHYGSVMVGHSREDMMHSKLILLWGWDPARMISGTDTMYHLIKARENGAKVIAIDPRYPGTDTAMMVAMAYVMITENLHDQAFLDQYTIGFDKYKDYVLGKEDGVAKTPAWAEAITRVPAVVFKPKRKWKRCF